MSTPGSCTGNTTVSASADVLGIGIRTNFYFTMLLLAIIPRTPHTDKLLNKLYENAGIAGFGLLLTAIIQTATNQLSLFEALFTLHILFFLGTGASPMGKYDWTKGRVVMSVVVQFVSVITFTAWGLYVWFEGGRFGSDANRICNDRIKYVIFFVSVRATALWLRVIWIVGLIVSAVGLMLSFIWHAMKLFEEKRMAEEEQDEEADMITRREMIVTPVPPPRAVTKKEEKQWYFKISFTLLFSAIYSTVMLELTVQRNNANVVKSADGSTQSVSGPGVVAIDNTWAFGQVLAVVMILANANEILHYFFGYLSRRKARLERRRQAQGEEIALQHEGHSTPTFYRPRGPSASNVSTRDQSADKISTGYELRNLDKRDADVSETITVSNVQAQDQPIGVLR